jgi:hypothetical protein
MLLPMIITGRAYKVGNKIATTTFYRKIKDISKIFIN